MLRAIVVDDEWYNLEEICDLIENTGFMSVEGRCQNAIEALETANRISPQIAFIDIEMPEMDGLTLAEKLLEMDPTVKIVFITAWNQYAVAAFELNALDYIMKPINRTRFNKMAERIRSESEVLEISPVSSLKIKCFGRLEVFENGKPIVWQRSKAEELFAFLLTNAGTFVHKDTILENLWPDYNSVKALPILQTSACKIRNVLSDFKKEVELKYSGNRYGLFIKGIACDYFEMERAVLLYKPERHHTFKAVMDSSALYGEGFLAQNGYLWSSYKDEEIRQKLSEILKEIAENSIGLKRLPVLRQLAVFSPCDIQVQLDYIQELKLYDKASEITRHLVWLENTLRKDFDTELPEKIK